MEKLRPVPVPIGGEVKLMNGGFLTAQYENPADAKRDLVQVGKVPRYEAEHVVVAENLGTRAKRLRIISDAEGVAEVSEPNVIAAATHIGDGDAHDRLVVISLGMEPSVAASLANQEKLRAQDEIDEVAREATLRRELSGDQIRNAMRDGREGRRVVILLNDREGNRKKEIRTRVKGKVAMVPGIEYELPKAA